MLKRCGFNDELDNRQATTPRHRSLHRGLRRGFFFTKSPMKTNITLIVVATVLAAFTTRSHAESADWLTGKYATGDWFGSRTTLESHGVIFSGSWKGTVYGNVAGGKDQRGAFDEEIQLGLKLDFEKLAGMKGLSAYGHVRYRDGENINKFVGASPNFSPSSYQVGKQWRFQQAYLTWESRDLLPVENMVTVSGGWQNPYHFFAQQPESKLFLNNTITQTKGIGANIPFNGSYAAWGGFAKIKPTAWSYIQGGLYAAVPNATNTRNHGLYFALADPADSNGLYFLTETGVIPKIGGLPGKYAFGTYYFGLENRSFFGETYDQKFGFYWQADQMLFREPTGEASAPSGKDGKSFKSPVAPAKPNNQGLYFISFLNYTPKYNNSLPFSFHTGFVYKGLIPTRDADQLGVAFAYGQYSYNQIVARRDAGQQIQQTYEAVFEFDYRIQLTQFAYVQPSLQYLIRPSGTGTIANSTVLALHMGVTF